MISFDLQTEFIPEEDSQANFDPPTIRQPEEWEVLLEQMKHFIFIGEGMKARKMMWRLELKIHDARMKCYKEGYLHGSAPLPF